MIILAFESSCDETAAAVVFHSSEGFSVKSNIVASQIETHRLYGGVVPEIASRAHTEAISRITYEALDAAGVSLSEVDLIAVTANPGTSPTTITMARSILKIRFFIRVPPSGKSKNYLHRSQSWVRLTHDEGYPSSWVN